MKNFNSLPLVVYLILVSCNVTNQNNKGVDFVDTATVFKKEIPMYGNGEYDFFYTLYKARHKQLGLDSIENGFENLQIRVWYDFSFVKKRQLVVITNTNSGWFATVYDMKVNWNGKTEEIISKKVKHVTPKFGWQYFSKTLLDFKIVTLPNQDDIADYRRGHDGSSFNIEVATKKQYRFYGYWEPVFNAREFWQAKNIVGVLQLFKDELGVSYNPHK